MRCKRLLIAFSVVLSVTMLCSLPNVQAARATQVNAVNEKGEVACATTNSYIYDANLQILGVVAQNQVVRVQDNDEYYYTVRFGDSVGYVLKKDFVLDTALVQYVKSNPQYFSRKVKIIAEQAIVFDANSGNVLRVAPKGTQFQLQGVDGEFYLAILELTPKNGIERTKTVRIHKDDARISWQLSVISFEKQSIVDEQQMDLITFANQFVGCSYVWGGTDPLKGVDCSGFVQYVYRQFGINLPRCSWEQAEVGTKVPFDEMQPGDLIFYYRGTRIGHVAMYLGDGKAIHARSPEFGICITDYDYSKPAWVRRILD